MAEVSSARVRVDVTALRLTTNQIATVLGGDASTARRRIARWAADGVYVRDALTGGRPTRTVAVEDVALRTGLDVGDVLALLGVRLAA